MSEPAQILLAWYDRHARVLPWRSPPGGPRPDPYRVWLSEVMLQQTTVAAVRAYFERFTDLWPRVQDLASADDDMVMREWAGLGYYARARNLLKCARQVAASGFPDSEEGLRALPGIGPYTAAAVAAIAFDRRAVVMDGNVERVMARIHDIHMPLPAAKSALKARADALTPDRRPGDFAQAVMDLGATICTPRSPACGICPWQAICLGRVRGTASGLPVKTPRAPKPQRKGVVWVGRRTDGAWLVERRPGKGLLGGTLSFPTTGWDGSGRLAPCDAGWEKLPGTARHTFTHFHLELDIHTARLRHDVIPDCGFFLPDAEFDPTAMPSLMRKVHALIQPTDLATDPAKEHDR